MERKIDRKRKFQYGMRARGYSLGCQPMDGFISRARDPKGRYYDVLTYERRLSEKEIKDYELDDLNKKASSRLGYFREVKGMRQSDLAEALGVSLRTVQGWEFDGMNRIRLESVVKVAKFLGVHAEDLYDGEKNEI